MSISPRGSHWERTPKNLDDFGQPKENHSGCGFEANPFSTYVLWHRFVPIRENHDVVDPRQSDTLEMRTLAGTGIGRGPPYNSEMMPRYRDPRYTHLLVIDGLLHAPREKVSLRGRKGLRIPAHLQMYWTSSPREIVQSHKSAVNVTAVVIS